MLLIPRSFRSEWKEGWGMGHGAFRQRLGVEVMIWLAFFPSPFAQSLSDLLFYLFILITIT